MAIVGSTSFGGSHVTIDSDKTTGHTETVAENKFNLIENNANIYNTNLGTTNKGLTVATSGSNPTTHTIVINNGTITGGGGRGAGNGVPSTAGEDGGDAIGTPSGLRLINMMSSSSILGGGGGGGRGATGEYTSPVTGSDGATSTSPRDSPSLECSQYSGANGHWYPSPTATSIGPGQNFRGTNFSCNQPPLYMPPPRPNPFWEGTPFDINVGPTHPGLNFSSGNQPQGPGYHYPQCVIAMHFLLESEGATTTVKPSLQNPSYGSTCTCPGTPGAYTTFYGGTDCTNTATFYGCPAQSAAGAAGGLGGIGSPGGTYNSTISDGTQGGNGGTGTSKPPLGCSPSSRPAAPGVSTLPGGAGGDGGRGGAAGQAGTSGYSGFAKNNRINPTSYGGGTYGSGTSGGSAGNRATGATIIE